MSYETAEELFDELATALLFETLWAVRGEAPNMVAYLPCHVIDTLLALSSAVHNSYCCGTFFLDSCSHQTATDARLSGNVRRCGNISQRHDITP